MEKLLIKGGKIVDILTGKEEKKDILVAGGIIEAVDSNINAEAKVIDAGGMYVFPGLIDAHAHLREPGYEYKEDIESASRAAIHGGVTTLFAMPNTNPPVDSRGLVEYVRDRGKQVGLVDVYPVGTITKKREGMELAEIGDMKEGGAIAFSDDGDWVKNSNVMRRALEYSKAFDTVIISHAEDKTLSQGVVHESVLSYGMGLEGYPAAQEEISVFRDIKLAELTGGRLHIAHLSSKGSVDIVKEAKDREINVTAEVTPNHLLLAQEEIDLFNPYYKVNPPIRGSKDRDALLNALREGTIDIIATDHAPHNWYEKKTDFTSAPWGMISLDFYFSLLYTELVLSGKLSLHLLLKATTHNPAKLFNLEDRGEIARGKRADLAIFDPSAEFVLTPDFMMSKSHNTPFIGRKLKGVFNKIVRQGKVISVEDLKG